MDVVIIVFILDEGTDAEQVRSVHDKYYIQIHSNICRVEGNEIAELSPLNHIVLLYEHILHLLP